METTNFSNRLFLFLFCMFAALQLTTFFEFSTIRKDIATSNSRSPSSLQWQNVADGLMHPYIVDYGASRVVLYKMHSSTISNSQVPIMDMTAIHSMIRRDKTELSAINVIQPLSIYAPVFDVVLKHRMLFVKVVDLPKGPLKEVLEGRNTEYAAWIDVTDKSGNVIGLMGLGWTKEDVHPEQNQLQDLEKDLRNTSIGIAHELAVIFAS